MKKQQIKTILAVITVFGLLTACNSSSETAEESETGTMEEMHGHESAPISTTVEIREDQSVFFPNLKDGQEITLPFVVEFGVKGMEIEPAGPINVDKGHQHLYVDQGPTEAGVMVPMAQEANGYFHFGKGQTSDTLQLSKYPMLTKGEHTLTLQFGNGAHISYGPAMSKTIKIKVK